jgi:hypothetical protein
MKERLRIVGVRVENPSLDVPSPSVIHPRSMKRITPLLKQMADTAFVALKGIYQHIDFNCVMSFIAFATLATALSRDYPLWFALTMAGIGIGMAVLAAHNSYVQKSTALLDKYEERFFVGMESKRNSAALFLLGEQPSANDLEDVLDYLESPIAAKTISGAMDPKQVYDVFYHWVRLYWQAGEPFINEYRKEEPAAWRTLKALYERLASFEKRILEDELKRPVTDEDLLLSQETLKKYLLQEAGRSAQTSYTRQSPENTAP